MRVAALAGGGGAAKFLRGLARAVDHSGLTIIGNTGDDADFYGLHVSPDLDIVMYTLAGIVGPQGWGVEGDTDTVLKSLDKFGFDTWFQVGDVDFATHIARTAWLRQGERLDGATRKIAEALGLRMAIIPATNDDLRTRITTSGGVEIDFQQYFVKLRHSVEVSSIRFEGAADAVPAPGVIEAIDSAEQVVICPSNPIVSIGPILSIPGVREALRRNKQKVVAVTPIVQGAALKGPADRLLPLAGSDASASGVCRLYADFCSAFVVDERDPDQVAAVSALGVRPIVADTVMKDPEIAEKLARKTLEI